MAVRFVICSAEGQPVPEGLVYGFEQTRIVLGRGAGADVRLPHLTVSETHASVRLEAGAYAIFDHGSTNGTQVNGVRLVPDRGKRLREGDRIELGIYCVEFHENVALAQLTTMERTAELARRLFRQSQQGTHLAAPRLCVLSGPETGKSIELPPPPSRVLVGRDATCQLVLPDSDVSREHAELVRDLDGVSITNLDSKNGIEINAQRVQQRRLRDGDELVLGATRLLFEDPADEPIENLHAESDCALPTPVPSPAEAPPPEPAATPSSAKPRRARSSPAFDADVLIYALAAIVIALSIAGLLLLMRAS